VVAAAEAAAVDTAAAEAAADRAGKPCCFEPIFRRG